jgi:catechol 2,3-dioxygenase-like lactoylglutathione lyase family enzyme
MPQRPPVPRFTHVALPCADVDASIAWYERFTPLRLLDRRSDAQGSSAWLGQPDMVDTPFILVLVCFLAAAGEPHRPTLAPFAHLGIELTERDDVDDVAHRGAEAGCLHWEAADLPPPIGYVCALTDPDGNIVEFSHGQGVYAKVQEEWGGDVMLPAAFD